MTNQGCSRRHFFFGAALAGAVPAAGFGSVASLKALGYKPYNEKLNIAAIGIGSRGGQDIWGCRTENIVALCDVDHKYAAGPLGHFEKAAKYTDYREMLDKEGKNIDAVIIATPDHTHASISLDCMQRGKGVYCEKPLTRTPWEARLLTDAAAKYKVATQMGNQGYSHEANRVAAEIIWSGEIGNVTEVHASTSAPSWPQGLQTASEEASVPEDFNWDLWLGALPMRPFSKAYAHFNWRGFYDFGTGPLGDWGIHVFGPVNLALQLTAPVSVEVLKQEGKSNWTFPTRSVLCYEFPARGNMPPVKLYWYDNARGENPNLYKPAGMEQETILPAPNGLAEKGRYVFGPDAPTPYRLGGFTQVAPGVVPGGPPAGGPGAGGPPRPGGPGRGPGGGGFRFPPPAPGVLSGNGAVFVGDKGLLATRDRGEGVHLLPAERWKSYQLPPQLLPRSPGHYQDWIRACKGGEPACSNFSVAGPFAEWVTLGAIAYRVEGKLLWEGARQRFTNSEAANRFVKPVFRKGSDLKL
ncbi:MAG: Gfo/Idh/MocA family oxidoreductase [Acidobacteria bacterium]|nr:Gfo/Idh/MocA family oxidoreductase [Acidobacteriota bacterium]